MLSLLNIFQILHFVRSVWNIIFGLLMIAIQLNWKKFLSRNFGFLSHWFLRGCFYIFVGTNAMTWGTGENGSVTMGDFFSMTAGFACVFVGAVELIFGFKCAAESEQGGADAEAGGGGRRPAPNSVEPTLTVNLTPNQVAQGAAFAANNASTIAAVGGAVASAGGGAGGGGGAPNPFFGNAHLNRN